MPPSFIILMILEAITVLAILLLPMLGANITQSGGSCCGDNFRPKTLKIGSKELDISQMNYTINKHDRYAKNGIKPIIPLHKELGVTKEELNLILV